MTFTRALSEKSEKELLVDYEDGWTLHELTIRYRISLRTVYRILARNDVPRKLRKAATSRKQSRTSRAKPKVRTLKPCGTNAAYARHKKAGEYPCSACLAAHAKDVAKYYKRKRRLKPCGTAAAGRRHYKRGEKPCYKCRIALAKYKRKSKKGKKNGKQRS